MTDDRLTVSPETVSLLLADQFPSWAHLPVRPVVPGGWDNRTFRLGDTLGVRLPSAARYSAKIEKETVWLPHLAKHLPVDVPRYKAVGMPGRGYPYPWAVFDWLPGNTLPDDAPQLPVAEDIADLLKALWRVPTTDGPAAGAQSFYRGGALAAYDPETQSLLNEMPSPRRTQAALIWQDALASTWTADPVWVHGDLTPGNMLFQNGRLSALIDLGLCSVGDPACDLAMYWTWFDEDHRDRFRAKLDLDAATWARAAGWVLWKALLTLRKTPQDATAARALTALGLPPCNGS